jgi:adenine-specific DNA-methyltransferase
MSQVEHEPCLELESPLMLAARLGREGCAGLDADHRGKMGQFLTPPGVGTLLAQMFDSIVGEVRLLDSGAGVGALTAAFVEEALKREQKPESLHLTAWEIEDRFVPALEQVLQACVEAGREAGVPTSYELKHGDMLREAVDELEEADLFRAPRKGRGFTHAIMNPPYRKINTDSQARLLLRRAGLETSNLYTGFLWLVARLLEPDGQMVAITPRSFCNGPYFLPFRERFFGVMALKRLHVFDRRDALFAKDEVLQENLVMYALRSAKIRNPVVLSSSEGLAAAHCRERTVPYSRVLDPSDRAHVLHVAVDLTDDDVKRAVMGMPASLGSLGIEVSTGRVVDFRARDFLCEEPGKGAVPLIYPMHFNGGCVHWPCPGSKKPNALRAVPETEELLVPNETYVLVKRFTAKEEPRRVVATVYRPEGSLSGFASVGFENHLNYFHCRGAGLDGALANGLALYLNSTLVDSYFRQFSGHTQVNATDLRSLRYPGRDDLCSLAENFTAGERDQAAIDDAVAGMMGMSRR